MSLCHPVVGLGSMMVYAVNEPVQNEHTGHKDLSVIHFGIFHSILTFFLIHSVNFTPMVTALIKWLQNFIFPLNVHLFSSSVLLNTREQ